MPQALTSDWILQQFAEEKREAQARYRRFVDEGPADVSPWTSLVDRIFLGNEGFAERLEARFGEVKEQTEIPRSERFAARPALDTLFGAQFLSRRERDRRIYQAYRNYGYTQHEIAASQGVHYATVSRAIKRVESELLDCKT